MKNYLCNPSSHKKAENIFLCRFFLHLLLFNLLICLPLGNLYSQLPIQEWVGRIPGPYNDLFGPFLQVDKQGNSYIAGTHVLNDTINILCVKYNTDGVQQWATLYKYPGYGYFGTTGLALDSSGNAYVIGGFAPTSLTPVNAIIVKLNSMNGSAVWTKSYFGEYGMSAFYDIKIDRLNNIYVVGSSDTSHLVIRYNTNGDSLWVRKLHPPASGEYPRACAIDDSLNVITTGYRRFYYPPYGYYDSLLVAKYSSGGVLRWESVYAYNLLSLNVGTKITADQNGSTYIGGETAISGDVVYLTLKFDRNGVRQWTKIYDAPGNGSNTLKAIVIDRINNALFATGAAVTNGVQMATTIKYNSLNGDSIWVRNDTGTYKYGDARAIKIDTIGNIYVTGVSSSTGSGAPVDVLTIKYSQMGVRNWLMTYNGPYNGLDIGKDIGIDKLNNIYVLGTSQSGFQLSDYIIIKYNQLSGINPISNTIPLSFNLYQNYPNPFNPSTNIVFDVAKAGFVTLRIYDILGREIEAIVNQELKPGKYEVQWNASDLTSGVYFYQFSANGQIVDTKKMIVIK